MRIAIVLVALLLLGGCTAGEAAEGGAGDGPAVVATHSILGDLVRNVAGEEVTLTTIMPIGADPHEFEASAQQIEAIGGADLLVANGLGFEEQLLEPITAAGADGVAVLELGEALDPIPYAGEEHAQEGAEDDDAAAAGSDDPHWFQDPARAATATRLIGARLAEVTGDQSHVVRAEAYAAQLEELAAEVEDMLGAVPESGRKLVTNHDAFGYFADRFGFEVVGTVIPGGADLAEPSAGELEELAATIADEGVPAIFAESIQSADLAETLAAEVGDQIEVVELYSDSLGEEGSEAATYVDLVRANAGRIAGALAP
jgi:zinc/manganese transport system substrate-binding protein